MSTNTSPTCGCCEGVAARTPQPLANRPGLSSLAYRVGTYGTFRQAMQVALRGRPALRDLATETDDPAVALMDAWAVVLDVLTFYQERIVNEHYLRTATERRSVLALARQIGYELRPGVAAGTFLAFTLEDAPGAPHVAAIPAGTRAQSIPGQDEVPQSFETTEEIAADTAWNRMLARRSEAFTPTFGDRTIYLDGVTTNLQRGDVLVLVGTEREGDPGNENWDVRPVKAVDVDRERNVTTVTFDRGLGSSSPFTRPPANPTVYAFRIRASAFGYNAPAWATMPNEVKNAHLAAIAPNTGAPTDPDWPALTLSYITGDSTGSTLYLDRVYKEIVPDSWVAVTSEDYVELYHIEAVTEEGRTGFSLAAKTTRLTISGEHLIRQFDDDVRDLVVHAGSEALPRARRPLHDAVAGREVFLETPVAGLEDGRLVAVTGVDAVTGEPRTEIATLQRADLIEETTRLTFEDDLAYAYARASVEFNANVAPATHGETRAEVLGSGNGAEAFQHFDLRNAPLTYVSAPTPSGLDSTLDVRVDGLLWAEVPTLYEQPSDAQVYTVRHADDGTATVQFGDGETGARLPTGTENVAATYRIGTGLEGTVGADQIRLLTTRPLGVKSVTNPLASTGADEPETLGEARDNAPLTVLTLDRVVSLQDVEDFVQAFPGVAKARVARLWDGETRFVHVTVVPADGQVLDLSSTLYANLRDALFGAWHGAERIDLAPHVPLSFGLQAGLTIDARYKAEDVLAAAHERLAEAFGFDARVLGQGVTSGEVMAVLQGVGGVVAVDLDTLGGLDALAHPRLFARPARRVGSAVQPAQLLILDADAVTLTEIVP